jgi:hypothetical protein
MSVHPFSIVRSTADSQVTRAITPASARGWESPQDVLTPPYGVPRLDHGNAFAGRRGSVHFGAMAMILAVVIIALGVGGFLGWMVRGSPGAAVGVVVGAIIAVALTMTFPAMTRSSCDRHTAQSLIELKPQLDGQSPIGAAADRGGTAPGSSGSALHTDAPTLRSGFFPVNKPTRSSRSGRDL